MIGALIGKLRRRQLLGAAAALAAGRSPALASPAAAAPLRRIGIGSCADQSRPAPIWRTIVASRPDFFVFAGDNVYASTPPWSRAQLEAAYVQLGRDADFAKLRDGVPHLAVWDDHDYGVNDGGAEFAHKAESKAAFLRFWRVPRDDPRQQREGIYTAQIHGPVGQRVQFIVLDLRWFRSPWTPSARRGTPGQERYRPDDAPGLSLLGETQWRWLEEQLRQPAELRLIVSSIQILAEGHGYERWGNFPRERQRLYELIAATGAESVVLLSGDRHIGAFYRETQGLPYALTEMTSSGLTHAWADAKEPGPNRLGDLVTVNHFGLIDIDWPQRRLHLALLDEQGRTRQQQSLSLDALRSQTGERRQRD